MKGLPQGSIHEGHCPVHFVPRGMSKVSHACGTRNKQVKTKHYDKRNEYMTDPGLFRDHLISSVW